MLKVRGRNLVDEAAIIILDRIIMAVLFMLLIAGSTLAYYYCSVL
jgi:hypothetical protein